MNESIDLLMKINASIIMINISCLYIIQNRKNIDSVDYMYLENLGNVPIHVLFFLIIELRIAIKSK